MSQPDLLSGARITTYVVAGHPRSGTSMMMRALATGGLDAAYTPAWDTMCSKHDGYSQNPNGFYELSIEDQLHPWFPARHWGKLIKVQYVQLVGLAPGRYRVVFMMRHPREIRMSYAALGAAARQRLNWDKEADYQALMQRFMAAAAMRADMDVIEVWYSDVLSDPRASFERIRAFGFPVDVERAAGTIDPALYRHRVAAASRPQPAAGEPEAEPAAWNHAARAEAAPEEPLAAGASATAALGPLALATADPRAAEFGHPPQDGLKL